MSSPPPKQIAKSLLLVEDHADSATTMRLLLESAGYFVIVAPDCETALRYAETVRLDLLLIDIVLPDGNGYQLLEKLTAHKHVPAIALTGFTAAAAVGRSSGARFNSYLVKPVDFATLQKEIAHVLTPAAL